MRGASNVEGVEVKQGRKKEEEGEEKEEEEKREVKEGDV